MTQRWYQKASVQSAVVAGTFLLLAAAVAGFFGLATTNPARNKEPNLPKAKQLQLNGASVAVVNSKYSHEDNWATISKNWVGPVARYGETTKSDFVDLVREGYRVLHMDAPIEKHKLRLDDGNLDPSELRDLLDTFRPDLIVLSSCRSAPVTRAVRDARVPHAIIARPDISQDLRRDFLDVFYQELAGGSKVQAAYERAVAATNARSGIDVRYHWMLEETK